MSSMENWNEVIASLPGASILQTREWANIKSAYGWESIPQVWKSEQGDVVAAAMVLRRRLRFRNVPLPVSLLYVPRGPLLDWSNEALVCRVIADLEALAKAQKALFLKMDPEVVLGWGIPGKEDAREHSIGVWVQSLLQSRGWLFAAEQVQFRNTAVLDLSGDEDRWLARMKPKTRYNLRLAERKGVSVRQCTGEDLGLLYRMYVETSVRDGFIIRPEHYYRQVWTTFMEKRMCYPLLAEVEGEPVAGLVLFVFAGRAWYFYGMSREVHREKMPNYLLQWEAMRLAKSLGAKEYDLWGAPEVFDESDPMWGVFRFKEGLGAQVVRTLGAWDFPVYPLGYRLFTHVLPRLLDVMRWRARRQLRREVSV
ncbi:MULTISPECIES: peptidoglycan bridge formation glycyltransferase FemA/FemB family protein [Anaerolinea]|uniref:lipid II:glycine glycyltransferase FemX n=1 Tax=Anaerolinea TaxID=233189 RepID=UPI00262636CA|nr:peptidoglycan bridge formation glycyltransferase FemA/FemB family protein [Anaerolinea thermophila]